MHEAINNKAVFYKLSSLILKPCPNSGIDIFCRTMAQWYRRSPSVGSLEGERCSNITEKDQEGSGNLSTHSSIIDDSIIEDLRREMQRMGKFVAYQNCTRPRCVSKKKIEKKMSTLSDSVSLAVSRNSCRIAREITRCSSLQEIRTPTPNDNHCTSTYCSALVSYFV